MNGWKLMKVKTDCMGDFERFAVYKSNVSRVWAIIHNNLRTPEDIINVFK